ncbi:hypothetical protein V8D89_002930 [Ganoderma adspersum]
MPPTTLNNVNDILLSIMAISPPKMATSIMATCRLLYHDGAKVILQSPVNLDGSEKEALALLRFVQAENLSRCPYVRALHIVMDTVPPSVAKILANVVPRLTGLERLALVGEQIFESYPHLLSLFASLRSVKTLLVLDAGARCCQLIRTLRSRLVSAKIHFEREQAAMLSLTASTHPVLLLAKSAATLESLSCGFLGNPDPHLTFFPPKTTYPKLRSLALSHSVYPDPVPFIRAAPNLAHLALESSMLTDLTPSSFHLQIAEMQRAMNLELQGGTPAMPFPMPVEAGAGDVPCRWAHLQTFTGRVVDLHLQLFFKGQPLTDALGAGCDLRAALKSKGAAGVTRLVVQLDVMAGDREMDVGRALDDLASAIAGLNLVHFQLGVQDGGLSPAAAEPYQHAAPNASSSSTGSESAHASACTCSAPVDRASLNVAERALDELDVHEYAKRLLGSLPSLYDAVPAVAAILGKGGEAMLCTGGEIVYREIAAAEFERTKAKIIQRHAAW